MFMFKILRNTVNLIILRTIAVFILQPVLPLDIASFRQLIDVAKEWNAFGPRQWLPVPSPLISSTNYIQSDDRKANEGHKSSRRHNRHFRLANLRCNHRKPAKL